jgi:large subunit ribosomal protein L25
MNKPLMVSVPLEFINEPDEQLKVADAHLHIIMREVEVECLPQDIPDSITVDLETFQVGEVLKAGELVLPAGVTLVTDAEEAVVAATIQGAEAEQGADEVEETETPAD